MSQGTKPPSVPPIVEDIMLEATSSVKGVLEDFPTPILLKIRGKLTREGMIDLHRLVSGNAASVV